MRYMAGQSNKRVPITAVFLVLIFCGGTLKAQVKSQYDRFTDTTTLYTERRPPKGFRFDIQIIAFVQCDGNSDHCPPDTEVDLGFKIRSEAGHTVRLLLNGKEMHEFAGYIDFGRNLLVVRLNPDQFRRIVSASTVEAQLSGDDQRALEMRFSKENMVALKSLSERLR